MKKETGEESKRAAKRRRGFPKALGCFLSVLFLVTLVCCAVITASALYGRTHYKISFYQETSQKVNSNVRLAVISDLHNRSYSAVIRSLRRRRPDLIAVTGDMLVGYRPKNDRLIVKYPQFKGYRKILPLLWIYHIGYKILFDRERITGNIRVLRNSKEDHREGESEP